MAKLVGKTYGDALLSLAVEENKTDVLFDEAVAIKSIFEAENDFCSLLANPKVTKEEKQQVLKTVFGGKVDSDMEGFLSLVLEKDRMGEIVDILSYFIDEMKAQKGIGVAYVTTSEALDDSQKKAVEDKLLSTTGFSQMEMHFSEDKTLIGGATIRIGDRIVDSSIKTKLEEMKRQLLKIKLA